MTEIWRFKNWERFQHYKLRTPPWIKLHRGLIDDLDYHGMPALSAKLLPLAWLLASENDGALPDIKTLAFRLRISVNDAKKALIDWAPYMEQHASNMLAECKQNHLSETETETETETEERQSASSDKNQSLSAAGCVFTELPCIGRKPIYPVTLVYVQEMQKLFPGVDIEKETLGAKGWLINNPKKGKTFDGMTRFLGHWYAKAQNDRNGHDPKGGPSKYAIERQKRMDEFEVL